MNHHAAIALKAIAAEINAAAATRPQLTDVRSMVNAAFVSFAGSNNLVAAEKELHKILQKVLAEPEMSQEWAMALQIRDRYSLIHRNTPDAWQRLVDAYHHSLLDPLMIRHRLQHCWPHTGPVELAVLFSYFEPSSDEPPVPPEPQKISVGEVLEILHAKFGEKIVTALQIGAHANPATTTDAKIRELVRDRIDPAALLPTVALIWPATPKRKAKKQ